jgi:hypothetical protein
MQTPFIATSLKGNAVKHLTLMVAGLWITTAHAAAPTANDSLTCGEIRTHIQAQTGVLSKPDVALLQQIAIHSGCRFTSAEVYRAAYGDKPMPKRGSPESKRRHHDDD